MNGALERSLHLDPDTVLFVGNGVLRVPSHGDPGPSWSQYMGRLWERVDKRRSGDPTLLPFAHFAQLSAPRQAEWFDRELREVPREDRAMLRLHLLGQTLHRSSECLTNPLLEALAMLMLQPAFDVVTMPAAIDVVTTNVDCAIEQNLATLIDRWLDQPDGPLTPAARRRWTSAEIEVIVDFRTSARWVRDADSPVSELQPLKIRLWKLHGCLRDLKARVPSEEQRRRIVALAGENEKDGEFCGAVPTADCLARHLGRRWRTSPPPTTAPPRAFAGVFSQTEYVENLVTLNRLAELKSRRDEGIDPSEIDREPVDRFAALQVILEQRPMGLVGYSLLDEDVDIVFALQRFQPPGSPRRWRLAEERERSASREERLRRMGIEWRSFEVPPVGFCREPRRREQAMRHEWREENTAWANHLQRVVAHAWLEPQLRYLDGLIRFPVRSAIPSSDGGRPPSRADVETRGRHRLVVVGLGSIWHGFALTTGDDFPNPRRVSAQLSAVDSQVPGGSGLVPVMVAAAIAGPPAAGSLSFVSNVPRRWSGWSEIEEFCLSAGVDVRPWQPADPNAEDTAASVGRTSHVIFFDPQKNDAKTWLPRQRYIMDVQSLTNPKLAGPSNPRGIKVPSARIPDGYQLEGDDDFLFSDKEVDGEVIRSWRGPTVYETGASGIELSEKLSRHGIRPTIWTGGVGSLLRTLVDLAGRSLPNDDPPATPEAVLAHLDAHPPLRPLMACGEALRSDYVARLVSFNKPTWRGGFSYEQELDYGEWLRDHWFELSETVLALMRPDAHDALAPPNSRIGGGLLATIHEGGLMALWRWPDRPTEAIVVGIERTPLKVMTDHYRLDIRCHARRGDVTSEEGCASVIIDEGNLTVELGGLSWPLGVSLPFRRNTLAAGDAVRGALAYGLWALAYRPGGILVPSSIARVMFASCVLATLKCYAGSFVDFLALLERLRDTSAWPALWGAGSS